MARKPKPVRPKGRIDTRLTISDEVLCDYIRERMKLEQREVNQQILYMLDFAYARMRSPDLNARKESLNG